MGLTAAPGQGFPSMVKTLRAFDRARTKTTINAIRRVLTSIRADAKSRIPQDGLGRKIWGRKASGLTALLKRERVRQVGDSFEGGLSVNGLAGLLERGGRIEPHRIKGGGFLANEARGFLVKAASGGVATVQHPGAPVSAKPRVRQAFDAAAPRFRQEVAAALGEAMQEAQNAA